MVGALLGALDGTLDGAPLGALDGTLDGAPLGALDGALVGTLVGVEVPKHPVSTAMVRGSRRCRGLLICRFHKSVAPRELAHLQELRVVKHLRELGLRATRAS